MRTDHVIVLGDLVLDLNTASNFTLRAVVDKCRDKPLIGSMVDAQFVLLREMGGTLSPVADGWSVLVYDAEYPDTLVVDVIDARSPRAIFKAWLLWHVLPPEEKGAAL